MAVKLLAFDMDGTLLRDDKTVEPATAQAIRKAMDQGIHIAIASGRDKNGVRFVYEPLGLDKGENFLALVNGQIIYDFRNKEYDLDDVLSPEDGLKIQAICARYGIEGIFCCGYDFYSYLSGMNRLKKNIRSALTGKPADYGLKEGGENRNFINLDLKPYIFTQDINKVCLIKTPEFFRDNMENLRRDLKDYDLLMVGPNWIEIMPKGIGKQSALKKIAEKLGFTMNEVMAFGDAENDVEMLRQAGIGVAMGNGMDIVKEAANITTLSNMENGIGLAIEALLDGKEEELRNGTLDFSKEAEKFS